MLSDFLNSFFGGLFGRNWRTTLSMVIAVVAGFIQMNNDLLPNPDGVIARISGYIMLGGFACFGINAKDKQVSGASARGEQ